MVKFYLLDPAALEASSMPHHWNQWLLLYFSLTYSFCHRKIVLFNWSFDNLGRFSLPLLYSSLYSSLFPSLSLNIYTHIFYSYYYITYDLIYYIIYYVIYYCCIITYYFLFLYIRFFSYTIHPHHSFPSLYHPLPSLPDPLPSISSSEKTKLLGIDSQRGLNTVQ